MTKAGFRVYKSLFFQFQGLRFNHTPKVMTVDLLIDPFDIFFNQRADAADPVGAGPHS